MTTSTLDTVLNRSARPTQPSYRELPANIDVVLLSDYHGEYLNLTVEEKLDQSLPIDTTQHAADEHAKKGFRETHPLDT